MSSLLEKAKKGNRKKTALRPNEWSQTNKVEEEAEAETETEVVSSLSSNLSTQTSSEQTSEVEAEADEGKMPYSLPITTVQKNFTPEKSILREMATIVAITDGLTFDCFVEALFAHYQSLDPESKLRILEDGKFRRSLRLKYQGKKTRKRT